MSTHIDILPLVQITDLDFAAGYEGLKSRVLLTVAYVLT